MTLFVLIIKSTITLLITIPNIVIYYQKQLNKDNLFYNKTIRMLIVLYYIGLILSILYIWLESPISKRIEIGEIYRIEPKITIKIHEYPEHLDIRLISKSSNSIPIEDLFFKFDIPGKFINSIIIDKNKCENCNISSSFYIIICGNDTIAETVYIRCRTIFPQAFIHIRINYSPTIIRVIPGAENKFTKRNTHMPIMDLHDYSKCIYSWSYKGDKKITEKYIDLRYLKYIQNDNDNLIQLWIRTGFYKRYVLPKLKEKSNKDAEYYTKIFLDSMERERKNW
jgi:hypothetical protein